MITVDLLDTQLQSNEQDLESFIQLQKKKLALEKEYIDERKTRSLWQKPTPLQTQEAYDSILARKKEEEKQYRQSDIEDSQPVQNSGTVVFNAKDPDDQEILNWAQNVQRGKTMTDLTKTKKEYVGSDKVSVEEGRPNSVPSNLPVIFGGRAGTAEKKERNKQYKEELERQMQEKQDATKTRRSDTKDKVEIDTSPILGGPKSNIKRNVSYKQFLEEQIREKEEIKEREKQKRLGRITSSHGIAATSQAYGNFTPRNKKDERTPTTTTARSDSNVERVEPNGLLKMFEAAEQRDRPASGRAPDKPAVENSSINAAGAKQLQELIQQQLQQQQQQLLQTYGMQSPAVNPQIMNPGFNWQNVFQPYVNPLQAPLSVPQTGGVANPMALYLAGMAAAGGSGTPVGVPMVPPASNTVD